MTRRRTIVPTPQRSRGEMDDELDRPLGCDQEEDRAALRWRIRPRRAAVAIVALAFTAVAALFLLAPRRPLDATLGGRSYALSKIEPYAPPPPKPAAKPAEAAKAPDAPAGSSVQLRSVDEHLGRRRRSRFRTACASCAREAAGAPIRSSSRSSRRRGSRPRPTQGSSSKGASGPSPASGGRRATNRC